MNPTIRMLLSVVPSIPVLLLVGSPCARAVEPAVAAGLRHSLFLKSDGTAWACGWNAKGQLGNGETNNQFTPVQVLAGVKAIAAGEEHSLFLKSDGTVWACGDGGNGELGNAGITYSTVPIPVQISNVKAIAAGLEFSVFLKNDGTVWTCGNMPVGTPEPRNVPVQVQISNVKAISVGYNHGVFLKNDGTAWGWGSNYFFQLGTTPNSIFAQVPIPIMEDVSAISASGYQGGVTLLVKSDGSVLAAGSNVWGGLGVGRDGDTQTAFALSQISEVVQVISFDLKSLFLKADGTLWSSGYLPQAFTTSNTPIPFDSNVLSAAAGLGHCLILKKDGKVYAAGDNYYGQLGGGSKTVPVMTLGQILSVTTTTGGTVTGGGTYETGQTATLTASPSLGYLFSEWDGDASGGTNPLAIVMDASKSVIARFTRNLTDSDGDGLSYYDEVVIHRTDPAIPDTDGDGFSDGFEVSTGFSPTAAASTPDTVSTIRTAVEFRFNAAAGISYRVEASPDLNEWSTIETGIVGTGGVVTRFYSTENFPKRYFRARRN